MKITLLILSLAVRCCGMDRFEALSQIESGDCDVCVGRYGEVSRYQILPSVWRQYTKLPLGAATNPFTARNVAEAIMADRARGVMWTDSLWYMVWHRPGRIFKPTAREADRAQRFANLCQSGKK
jgi:hypothetical protein